MEAIDLCMRNLRTEVDRLKKEKSALIQDNNDLHSRVRVLSEELKSLKGGKEVEALQKRVNELEQQLQIVNMLDITPGTVLQVDKDHAKNFFVPVKESEVAGV